MLKKSFTLFLLLSIIVTIIACSANENEPKNNPTDTTVAEEEEDTYSTRRNVKDDLPVKDFEGYNFSVYLRDVKGTKEDFEAENETGDIINDAVYARNLKVSERFNVNIVINYDTSGDTTYNTSAVISILADEDVNDVLGLHGAYAFVYAKQNYIVDWKTNLPYVNLEKPWWDQDFAKNLAIANRLFAMTGDISHLSIGATFCMVFNKVLFDKYVLEYPYKSVIDGTWTFDKFAQIVKDSSIDLNGDNIMRAGEDLYGFTTGMWGAPIQAFYMAGDRIITLDKDGVPSLTVYNERTIGIFEKFFNLANNYNFYIEGYSPSAIGNPFKNNLVMLSHAAMGSLVSLRDMESDIGIIPFPKYDELVENYPSLVDAGQNIFAVPVTARDLERTSIILEALAAEGYRNVVPTFYEQALQVKYARDDDSAAMLDIIRDSRIFDYGYFDATISWNLSYTGRVLVEYASHDFASFYAKEEAPSTQRLADLYEQYLKLGE